MVGAHKTSWKMVLWEFEESVGHGSKGILCIYSFWVSPAPFSASLGGIGLLPKKVVPQALPRGGPH